MSLHEYNLQARRDSWIHLLRSHLNKNRNPKVVVTRHAQTMMITIYDIRLSQNDCRATGALISVPRLPYRYTGGIVPQSTRWASDLIAYIFWKNVRLWRLRKCAYLKNKIFSYSYLYNIGKRTNHKPHCAECGTNSATARSTFYVPHAWYERWPR